MIYNEMMPSFPVKPLVMSKVNKSSTEYLLWLFICCSVLNIVVVSLLLAIPWCLGCWPIRISCFPNFLVNQSCHRAQSQVGNCTSRLTHTLGEYFLKCCSATIVLAHIVMWMQKHCILLPKLERNIATATLLISKGFVYNSHFSWTAKLYMECY